MFDSIADGSEDGETEVFLAGFLHTVDQQKYQDNASPEATYKMGDILLGWSHQSFEFHSR